MESARKPLDVTTRAGQATDRLALITWSRPVAGGTVDVSFIPSDDPNVRDKQEADVARHLDERTPKR